MHKLKELCYLLEDEVGQVVKKGEISPSELDNIYKAVKTMYYAEGMKAYNNYNSEYPEYSERSRMNNYNNGSYGMYDSRSSYGNSRNYARHSKSEMIDELERMMENASTEAERRSIRECIREMEK